MHPVLMLTRNNLELTKKAVESVLAQSLEDVEVWVHDNGSTDGTVDWLLGNDIPTFMAEHNDGVSYGWNRGLRHLLEVKEPTCDHVLVINNDVILPEHFYAALLSYDVPFVTGVAVDTMEGLDIIPYRMPLAPSPDFSAFLIGREAWNTIGEFNERMMLYTSDCDYHVRGHRLGVGMWKANVPYYHERSSTINKADPQEQAVIRAQADADRGVFRSIYGCVPGDPEYAKLFLPVEEVGG